MRILRDARIEEGPCIITARELVELLVGPDEARKLSWDFHEPDAPVFLHCEDADAPTIHPLHSVDSLQEHHLEKGDDWRLQVTSFDGQWQEGDPTIVVLSSEPMPVRCQGCGNPLQQHEIELCDACEDSVAEDIHTRIKGPAA